MHSSSANGENGRYSVQLSDCHSPVDVKLVRCELVSSSCRVSSLVTFCISAKICFGVNEKCESRISHGSEDLSSSTGFGCRRAVSADRRAVWVHCFPPLERSGNLFRNF